jgi:uncharacterized integral membrane protein
MSGRRLRSGELLAGIGAAVLFLSLFLDWFEPEVKPRVTETSGRVVGPEQHLSGWTSLGWVMIVVLLAVIVLAIWLAASTLFAASVSQPVAAGVLLSAVGSVALGALVVRVAIVQPDLGIGLRDDLVAVRWPAYLGIAALAVVVAGGWISMGDERTDAPESATTPPPARPAPPERL